MSFVETRYEHIVLDGSGVPHIAGTTMAGPALIVVSVQGGERGLSAAMIWSVYLPVWGRTLQSGFYRRSSMPAL